MNQVRILLTEPGRFCLYGSRKNVIGFPAISLLGTRWLANTIYHNQLDYCDPCFTSAVHYSSYSQVAFSDRMPLLGPCHSRIQLLLLKASSWESVFYKVWHMEKSNHRALPGCWCSSHKSISQSIVERSNFCSLPVWVNRFYVTNSFYHFNLYTFLNYFFYIKPRKIRNL